MSGRPIAYLLKMYPRFSETFILSEVLELERQGVDLRIFSLKKPDDGRFHADLARVRASVAYLPETPFVAWRAYLRQHREVYRWDRCRYLRVLWGTLRRRRTGALKRFLQAGYLAPILRCEGIAHVHAHFASSATSVAHYLHRLAGISYSFTAHAKDIYLESVSADVLTRKLRSARFAITVSDFNREHLAQLANGGPVLRIYNGLDLRQFSPREAPLDDPPLVLGVGRLVEKKGFADLVRACALLREMGRRFHCQIVGKGPLQSELLALIRDLHLEGVVELVGPLPREALLDRYPRAALCAAPCLVGTDGNRDGLPTVLIEALALGVPVVSTDVTGIPELVTHEQTGLLVPQRDPAALAAAIQRLLTNRDEARAFAIAGRRRVEEAFDIRRNVTQLAALLEQASRDGCVSREPQ